MCDNFFEIIMAKDPMTEIYADFRSYRPGNHLRFLEWVKHKTQEMGVNEFVMSDTRLASMLTEIQSFPNNELRPLVLYLHGINEVRNFRWRHWCFCKEYILKNTKHPTATGGSPIIDVSALVSCLMTMCR